VSIAVTSGGTVRAVTVQLRQAQCDDHTAIAAVLPQWWDGRPVDELLQRLFFEHFASTSLIAEDHDELAGFLVGFVSTDRLDEAYVHFVGVAPEHRGDGIGRLLHDRFAQQVAALGVRTVRCITAEENTASVRFHESIGFSIDGRERGHVQMSRVADVDEPRMIVRLDPRSDDEPFPTVASERWPITPGTRLVGDAVELTVADPDVDGPPLFSAIDDDEVWAHVAGRPTDADGMRALLRQRTQLPGWCPWVVRLRRPVGGLDEGAVVGTTSFLDVVPHDARGEIGATLSRRSVWGSEVNPACKLALMIVAFEELGWGRVQLKTDIRNHRSQRAIARLGATYEGTLSRYQRRTDGTVRDTVLFAITADCWPAVKEALQRRLTTQPTSAISRDTCGNR